MVRSSLDCVGGEIEMLLSSRVIDLYIFPRAS